MEALALDRIHHSLIIAPKDRDNSDDFKGLYRIPIASKAMNRVPNIKISMDDGALKAYQKKKKYKTFNPSDIAIHPTTGDYYVLEGINPKLLILDSNGTIQKVYELDEKHFAQPEGITFSPEGKLYISNESGDAPASIVQVTFN